MATIDSSQSVKAMPGRFAIEAPVSSYDSQRARALGVRLPELRTLLRRVEQQVLEAGAERMAAMDAAQLTLFRLGVRAAPLFVGFALFIAEQSRADRVSRVYCFTREGELFQRVLEHVFPDGRHGHLSLPPFETLEVSRLATFSASLGSVSLREMMRLWSLYNSQSIFALAKSLKLEPELLETYCTRYGIEPQEDILRPWADPRVRRLFEDGGFKRLLSDRIDQDRQAALAYFEQRGVGLSGGRVGVVDIGWRGTIQDNMALMLPRTQFVGYYLGLQRFLNPQPPNCLKKAFGPNANRDLRFSHLLDAVSPMEMLCNSPHGSVMGYRRMADGQVRAVRLAEASETAIHGQRVRHFQDGILLASDVWSEPLAGSGLRSSELRESACRIWSDLITKPQRPISEAYAALNHNDVFGVGCFVDKRRVPSPRKLLHSLVSPRTRREVVLYIKQTQWSPGLWHRRDLAPLHKVVLGCVLAAGRAYKRTRMWVQHRSAGRGEGRRVTGVADGGRSGDDVSDFPLAADQPQPHMGGTLAELADTDQEAVVGLEEGEVDRGEEVR